MIQENTVFILGAGASIPYGFPSGVELRKLICSSTVQRICSLYHSFCSSQNMTQELKAKIEVFQNRFFDSGIYSIDRFLERNPKYLEIGKLAIALNILEFQNNSKFDENIADLNNRKSDWYSFLYNELISGLNTPDGYLAFNQNSVKFITFNYDSSLRHYLYTRLQNSYENISESKCREIINNTIIHHVYGCIGYDDYKQEINYHLLQKKSELLSLIRNGQKDEVAADYIKDAKRIYILGFGFDEDNMNNIGFYDVVNNEQAVYATAIGINENRIQKIKDKIQYFKMKNKRSEKYDHTLSIENKNCRELLESYL